MASVSDLRTEVEAQIRRSDLLDDGYAGLLRCVPPLLDRVEALVERIERVGGGSPDPRIMQRAAKAAMSSEERRRWMIGCAVAVAVSVVLAATAGWSFRDSMLQRRCTTMYQASDCHAITRW